MGKLGPECAGIILVGGESRRMGSPKAWLGFGGRPLLRILAERLNEVFEEVLIVSAPGQALPDAPGWVVHDERPGEGPMAGLAVALREMEAGWGFVTACDAPFLSTAIIREVAETALEREIAVPEWGGRLQPLTAAYRRSLQPLIEQRLAVGQRRVRDIVEMACTEVIPEGRLRQLDPEGLSFLNVNTPEDYQRALKIWAERE